MSRTGRGPERLDVMASSLTEGRTKRGSVVVCKRSWDEDRERVEGQYEDCIEE